MPRSIASISCPFCRASKTDVTNVSHHEELRDGHLTIVTRRRRRCRYCGQVFKTLEVPVADASNAGPPPGGQSDLYR